MNKQITSGFTIIEVMLFLAITGLLIAGILGGTTTSLNNQRYRDGVESFRNTIRDQYATVFSLTNMTTNASGDNAGANAVDPCSVIDSTNPSDPGTAVFRGSSDCLYVGRLVVLTPDDGSKTTQLAVYPVVAKVLSDAVDGVFDLTSPVAIAGDVTDGNSLQVAAFTRNENLIERKQIDWGLTPVTQKPSQRPLAIGFLMFRSPLTGSVTTYVIGDGVTPLDDDTLHNLTPYIQQSSPDDTIQSQREVKLCMADLGGPLDQAHRMAVIVHKGATGPGDIETLGEAAGC